nr:hypothetical protein [Tanacetum cinerariifolium]
MGIKGIAKMARGSDDDSKETVKVGAGKDDDDDDDEDNDDNDEEEELAKSDEEDKETGKGGDEVRESEDTHVTLTPVNLDGPQESSSMSSFVSSMLNPTCNVGVESIFTTASSLIVSLQTPTPIITPSTIATITTSSEAPIPPPIIPSIILENLPTFNSAFRFEERLRSLETSFSKYRQTNPFADAVSVIPADLSEMELRKILIEKMEGNKSIQRSNEQRNLYKALVEAYDADKAILDTYGDSTILKRRREDDDQEGPSTGLNQGSKRQKEGGEQASASTPSEKATEGAGRSTTGSQSRQMSANESAFTEEPVQTTCQMEETLHPVFETGADDQPIIQTSQHPEWFSQPRRQPSPDHYGHIKWIEDLVPREMWIQQPIDYNKHALWGVSHWGKKCKQFYGYAVNWESARDDVHKEHCHQEASGRSSTRSGKLLEEAQPYEARHNKDKKNRLMRIDKLHKFSDGTLNDVRNALDDRLKGIRMQYFPSTIRKKGDKDKAAAMIQAIEKILKTRRIMRSLEKFVGGRLYKGDFRMLQRTI